MVSDYGKKKKEHKHIKYMYKICFTFDFNVSCKIGINPHGNIEGTVDTS